MAVVRDTSRNRGAVVEETKVTPQGTTWIRRVNGKVVALLFEPNMEVQAHKEPRPTICTDCGAASDNLRWFRFATYACPSCSAKRDAKAQREREMGEVCPRCHQPFSLCVH